MAYLIDANCLIEPKNRYYAFDFCPGFWDWLDQQNRLRVIFSIDRVGAELARGNDDLANWARLKGPDFFLPLDNAAILRAQQIAEWLDGTTFPRHVIQSFLACADPFLVAYALAHEHTIVTHEIHHPNQTSRIKIPTVCQHFGVPTVSLFEAIRATGAKLVLL